MFARRHAASASSGICSMNRSRSPRSIAQASSAGASSSVSRMSTALSLIGPSPARTAPSMPASTARQPVASGQAGEVLAVDRVDRDVDPRQARLDEPAGDLVEPDAVRGHRHRHPGSGRGRQRDDLDEVGARQRLAAGEAHLVDAELAARDPDQPRDLDGGQQVGLAGCSADPSAGMQYVQRSEHFSVTEMRRSRATRPNRSTRPAVSGRPVVSGALEGSRWIRGIPSRSVDMSSA